MRLEIPMGTKGFFDMTGPAVFCVELNWLEILNIICKKRQGRYEVKIAAEHTGVEKHIPNCSSLLVNFEGVPGEGDTLGDDAGGVRVKEASHSHELWSYRQGAF